MNSDELATRLDQLGCPDDVFAQFLGVTLRSVTDWKLGRREIPRYVDIALDSPKLLELLKFKGESQMSKEQGKSYLLQLRPLIEAVEGDEENRIDRTVEVKFSKDLNMALKEASASTKNAKRNVQDSYVNKVIDAEFAKFRREGPLTEVLWDLRLDHGYCVIPLETRRPGVANYLFFFSSGPGENETTDDWHTLFKGAVADHEPSIKELVATRDTVTAT